MLTIQRLQDAKKKLLKLGGAIYIVQSAGKVEVWVNSAGYSAVSMGTHVIQMLDVGAIDYNFVTYQRKNMQMNLQEFCDMVNEEYCNLTGTLIFDNGGGLTLQLNNSYAHWYQNMNQAAEDLKAYIKDGNTEYWDGHEEESMELDPECEQTQSGGYRVYSMEDIISMTEEEYMDSGWGNVRDFCIAYNG